MPFVDIRVNREVDEAKIQDVATAAHNAIKSNLGKPDKYIMVDVNYSPHLQFAGNKEPAAVVTVHSIGFSDKKEENKQAILLAIQEALGSAAGVIPTRMFIFFADEDAKNVGWNGTFFG